jgi:D-lactate dehydrogenase (cytochrome)
MCCFADLGSATSAVYETLRRGIAVSRVELLDVTAIRAINSYAGSDFLEHHTLIFEVAGSSAAVAEQLASVREIVATCGAAETRTATDPEGIDRIWQARHMALPASEALVRGSSSWSTDVCVPISDLADSILAAYDDIEKHGVIATIVGHVGDGNFHLAMILPPDDPDAVERATRVNEGLVERAIAVGGTCSGEHGIGRGKRESLRRQYGSSIDVMKRIKDALDPDGILNPGAVLPDAEAPPQS